MGLGSIKNVGTSVVDFIVENREKNGEFKDFGDFCERMQDGSVNKKCIESLIKAGVFDSFEQTRSTLMASFEDIVDSISDSTKKSLKGQVSMFDMAFGNSDNSINDEENNSGNDVNSQLDKMKYNYTILKEYSEKELLSMEKEMLGLYISGHPLEQYRSRIEEEATINTLKMREIQDVDESVEMQDRPKYRDGQIVRIVGIVDSVKKKYTKTNKIMAFTTIEDLYGQCEVIVFENCYQMCSGYLMEGSIVVVEGRLSIREDEDVKVVANKIIEFKGDVQGHKSNVVTINITNLSDKQKDKLRGAIKFFAGDRNNCRIDIKNGERVDSAGGVLMSKEILNEFIDIVGNENIVLL